MKGKMFHTTGGPMIKQPHRLFMWKIYVILIACFVMALKIIPAEAEELTQREYFLKYNSFQDYFSEEDYSDWDELMNKMTKNSSMYMDKKYNLYLYDANRKNYIKRVVTTFTYPTGDGTGTGQKTVDSGESSKGINMLSIGYINFNIKGTYKISSDLTFLDGTTLNRTFDLYTITYHLTGGTDGPTGQLKRLGNKITLSNSVPYREGYDFLGWSTSQSSSTIAYQPGDTYAGEKSMTLYAVWKKKVYTVQYNANGGSNAPASDQKVHDEVLVLSGTTPQRTGYEFAGWAENSNAAEPLYKSRGNFTANKNVILYAVWNPVIYTVTYDANGGSNAPSSQNGGYHSVISLRTGIPERAGYSFRGWSLSRTSNVVAYNPGDKYTVTKNLSLYAVWQLNQNTGQSGTDSGGKSDTNANSGTNTNSSTKPTEDNGMTKPSTGGNSTRTEKTNQVITASSRTVAYKSKPFLLNAKASGGGTMTYKSNNNKVAVVNSKGKVTVKNYGEAVITIKAAATSNCYMGMKKITIKVVPKKMTLKSVGSKKKKRIEAAWSLDKSSTGYQVYLSLRKDFKRGTYERTYKKSKGRMSLKGLKSKKTYYIKIRAYKTVGKKKYYGAWSNVKRVTVK